MNAGQAKGQFEAFCQLIERSGLEVQCGVFGAYMKVESINDGPFTLLWSS
jgi:D-Tyr-tRNAtyr deacylase